jgi:hypothetical protein
VQEGDVAGVDLSFHALAPVGALQPSGDELVALGSDDPFELRHLLRHYGGGSHKDPHHATLLTGRIGHLLDPLLEMPLRRFVGHIHARARDVELPAVVSAAEPGLLVAAEEQRSAPMRAEGTDDADPPGRVPESHQVLAEEPEPHRRPIAIRDLGRHQRWQPEPPEELTHGRSGPDLGQHVIVFDGQHGKAPYIDFGGGPASYLTQSALMPSPIG